MAEMSGEPRGPISVEMVRVCREKGRRFKNENLRPELDDDILLAIALNAIVAPLIAVERAAAQVEMRRAAVQVAESYVESDGRRECRAWTASISGEIRDLPIRESGLRDVGERAIGMTHMCRGLLPTPESVIADRLKGSK